MPERAAACTGIILQPISVDAKQTNGKGAGKIIPRSGVNRSKISGQLSLQPRSDVNKDEPPPRYPAWICGDKVQSFDVRQSHGLYAAWDILRSSKPACLLHAPVVANLLPKWNAEYLAGMFGGSKQVDVLCAEERSSAYLDHDPEKNIFGSFYHVREPKTRKLPMTLPEFTACLTSWTSKKLLLKAQVMHGMSGQENPEPEEGQSQDLQKDLKNAIDWQWIKDAQQMHKWGSVRSVSLEIGSQNGLQPAQYEDRDRLLCQVSGRRRILLIGPEHAHHGMYPFPVQHTYDGYAMPSLDSPDTDAWPKLADVRGLTVMLEPGQLLFIPAYWFVHIQDMDSASTTLVFAFYAGMRLQSEAAMGVAISRLIEERVGLAEGMEDVRKWLIIISCDDEEKWLDVGTVRGYKRVVMCQEVRDEVRAVLGEDTDIKKYLLALCDDRLMPTPWLNKDFREPLYLTDKPVRLLDNRTDEELRYPELFQHRLRTAPVR